MKGKLNILDSIIVKKYSENKKEEKIDCTYHTSKNKPDIHRKNYQKTVIRIMQKDGGILYQGMITEIPLKEEYILTKSIELFKEKEPCIIYRTHILKRFYLEFFDTLCELEDNEILCTKMSHYFKVMDLNGVCDKAFFI